MKKIIIGSLLVVFLSACSVSETFKDDPEFTAMRGILSAQKTDDEYQGTHLLTDEGGKVTPIRSLSINLDSSKYLNNKIEALGILNPDDTVFEVTGISVIEILNNDDTQAQFVLYRNTEFGFEMNYYDNWVVDTDEKTVTFTFADEERSIEEEITVGQIPYAYYPTTNEDGSTDNPLGAYFLESTGKNVAEDINKLGVDELDAVKQEDDNSISYTLYRSGLVYRISYTAAQDSPDLETKNTFLEMVNTFRFIAFEVDGSDEGIGESEVDTANQTNIQSNFELTSFESALPYFFSGKYPQNWYYAGRKGNALGVKHHYGFSDESVTNENELISLDVLANPDFSGQKKLVGGKEIFVESSSDVYIVYLSVEGQNYKLSGKSEYQELILTMALSIEAIKKNSEDAS